MHTTDINRLSITQTHILYSPEPTIEREYDFIPGFIHQYAPSYIFKLAYAISFFLHITGDDYKYHLLLHQNTTKIKILIVRRLIGIT